jgi:SAM-dependent methyltransferase
MATVNKDSRETTDGAAEFDAFAGDYDEALNQGLALSGEGKDFFAQGRAKWLAECLQRLNLRAGKALDFGCGTGSATPFLFEELGIESLSGTDPSAESLQVARETWSDKFAVEFSDGSDDLVAPVDVGYCNGVFHHIPVEERAAAMEFIARNVRTDGIFSLWENNPWNPVTRYAMSKVPFDADAILVWPWQARRYLREAGFEILRTDYAFFFPHFARALRPLERALRWMPMGGQYQVLARRIG